MEVKLSDSHIRMILVLDGQETISLLTNLDQADFDADQLGKEIKSTICNALLDFLGGENQTSISAEKPFPEIITLELIRDSLSCMIGKVYTRIIDNRHSRVKVLSMEENNDGIYVYLENVDISNLKKEVPLGSFLRSISL